MRKTLAFVLAFFNIYTPETRSDQPRKTSYISLMHHTDQTKRVIQVTKRDGKITYVMGAGRDPAAICLDLLPRVVKQCAPIVHDVDLLVTRILELSTPQIANKILECLVGDPSIARSESLDEKSLTPQTANKIFKFLIENPSVANSLGFLTEVLENEIGRLLYRDITNSRARATAIKRKEDVARACDIGRNRLEYGAGGSSGPIYYVREIRPVRVSERDVGELNNPRGRDQSTASERHE